MKAINLKTEYLKEPRGIDYRNPRLMWNCEGGIRQTAYRIVCKNDLGEMLWDSGKVESASMRAAYEGKPLESRDFVSWSILLWDENGQEGEEAQSWFEEGLLDPSDWKAQWISGNYKVDKKRRYPVDCFRKCFTVSKPLRKARIYVTACGLYELRLGDEKVGDFCLAPGITDYTKRVQYQTYDVTERLQPGDHEIRAQLADGWYRGSVGAWGLVNQYGTETKLLLQLELTYEDGSTETIATDESWDWSNDGPIRFADNKDGEIVEAFRRPLYDKKARVTKHPVVPTASDNVPVTEHEHFRPVISISPNGRKLLDFGQNIAGYIRFSVQASAGRKMLWRFGEMLDPEGNLTLDNIQCKRKDRRTPLQQIEYTCGEGRNDYKTTFAVFGFRYAEVDTDVEIREDEVEAIAVYSDMETTYTFASSNELLNRLVRATEWSTKSNSLDLPTDCPTRERHGWTGDAQIFFRTAAYMFDYAAFSDKYLRDMYDWQKKNGKLPQIAPYGGVDFYMAPMNGSVGWADAGILIPYRFFRIYGDRQILVKYYDGMQKYARFMMGRIGRDGVVRRGQSYGEWAEPQDVTAYDWKDMAYPHPEVSTAYTAYVLGVMSRISRELGKEEDEKTFREAALKCRTAYQKLADIDTDRQAMLVRPLYMKLLSKEQTEQAEKRLIEALEHYDWRLGTGFLSTPLILSVLEKIDIEAAYRLLENEKMPGWLFMPKKGATTIWESWEGTEAQGGIASLNHYSKGAVCEWLFRSMCGIRVEGENHFVIAPMPGGHFEYASASYQSAFGKVESGWRREGSRIVFSISIPANCTAELRIPGQETQTVGAGTLEIAGEVRE